MSKIVKNRTSKGLRATLKRLGKKNFDEIARFLARKGITGRPKDIYLCPIANYLRELGFIGIRDVSKESISCLFHSGLISHTIEVQTPENVADFIHCFDRGDYPELRSTK